MRVLDNELKDKLIDYDKLLKYGFIQENGTYLYKTKIHNGEFELEVTVKNNKMPSKVIDLMNEDEYILVDIKDSTGEFVGNLRKEYEEELQNIIEKCTVPNIFKSEQAKEIIKYVKEKYNDELEYLWKKFPENAIWRNKKNNKWYGLLLVISERKLGIESDKIIEIIDLRYSKENIKEIIDNNKIFPGYHMNKESWITIRLNGDMNTKKILELIDNSYKLSLAKSKRGTA